MCYDFPDDYDTEEAVERRRVKAEQDAILSRPGGPLYKPPADPRAPDTIIACLEIAAICLYSGTRTDDTFSLAELVSETLELCDPNAPILRQDIFPLIESVFEQLPNDRYRLR